MAAITRFTSIRLKLQSSPPFFLLVALTVARLGLAQPNPAERQPVIQAGVYLDIPTLLPKDTAGLDLSSVFGPNLKSDPQLLAKWDKALETSLTPGFSSLGAKAVTHVLARENTAAALHKSLREGRIYVAQDSLADSAGFAFAASNNLGVFQIGDSIPLFTDAKLTAMLPIPAKLRLIHNGKVVSESTGIKLEFRTHETGYYRLEAWLEENGEQRPWILANPIFVTATSGLRLPPAQVVESVDAKRDVEYVAGEPQDAAKHKLDVYVPKGKTNLPVFVFIHGGSWRQGDRSQYVALGSKLAQDGMIVVIPSYRLAPKNQHPAQIDDVRAAFRWTVAHVAELGGDPSRIYVGGHSAGGHLAALLGLTEPGIKGVAALSGVYEVSTIERVFTDDQAIRKQASPITHVKAGSPEFTISYCQWDYLSLPQQAEMFAAALKEAGVKVNLVYVQGESHISEIINAVNDFDRTHQAITDLVR